MSLISFATADGSRGDALPQHDPERRYLVLSSGAPVGDPSWETMTTS